MLNFIKLFFISLVFFTACLGKEDEQEYVPSQNIDLALYQPSLNRAKENMLKTINILANENDLTKSLKDNNSELTNALEIYKEIIHTIATAKFHECIPHENYKNNKEELEKNILGQFKGELESFSKEKIGYDKSNRTNNMPDSLKNKILDANFLKKII